ncbi:hypothetical protein Dda_8328 [Drechslerella dactyloides]|uniref:Transmembrane protein n=1 Tax=Drechslerella dactyloides TaxID=74499 RepID=A0AAD6NES6_DREDA|nr:hypothetical protein Dda_8328 [Drechslerella dactyloides]
MKFSSILFAVVGLCGLVSALPAPVPLAAADASLQLLEKRDLIEREPAPVPNNGGGVVSLVADVQVCIDAVIAINAKYVNLPRTSSNCKAWAAEIVVKIKILISVIKSYPENCVFPQIDVCVNIFIKLIVCIFVQLNLFCNGLGGLLASLLATVTGLLGLVCGLVPELIDCILDLCILIEARIKIGICGLILNGCGGLLSGLWINVIIKLCLQVGIAL